MSDLKHPVSVNPQVNLRIPAGVRQVIQSRAEKLSKKIKRVVTLQEVILGILARECGIDDAPKPARGRPKKSAQ